MKRQFSIVLTLLLTLALLLSACGKTESKEAAGEAAKTEAGEASATESKDSETAGSDLKAEISVQAEEGWMDYYKAAAERVNAKYPDVKINLITVGAFDHLDTIDNTDVNNKDVADLFAIPADRLYGLAENQALAAIDSQKIAAAIGGWDNFDAGIGGNFKMGDDYLAFPYNIETLINFINVANAKEAGLDLEKPIELNDQKDPKTVLLPVFDAWYGVAATNSASIELLGKDGDKLFTDMTKNFSDLEAEKKAAIEAIFEYWKKNFEANSTLFDNDAGWGYVDSTFATGGGGVIRLGGPWDAASIGEQAGEGSLLIKPIQNLTVAGKPLAHWKGGWGLAINARCEEDAAKMEACSAVIAEIVNPDYAVDLYKATGKILENVKAETYAAASDLNDTDKAVIAAVIESYKTAPARPLFTEWGKVWDTWKNALLSWNTVQPKTAEEAFDVLKASFEAMMNSF